MNLKGGMAGRAEMATQVRIGPGLEPGLKPGSRAHASLTVCSSCIVRKGEPTASRGKGCREVSLPGTRMKTFEEGNPEGANPVK
jgi:hypothetical protein